MLTSLLDSPVYKSMSSQGNYISRKDVGGNKDPTIQLSFLLIEAIIHRISAELMEMGRVGGTVVIKLLIF